MHVPAPVSPADFSPRIIDLPIDVIFDGDRLRGIDPAWAAAMAASLEGGAELPPIVVRRPEVGEEFEGEVALVVGGHRLAAHRLAGRLTIRAEVRSLTRLQARLVEIEENLIRHELTALDRAVFLAEHKRVYEELHPTTQHGAAPKSRKKREELKSQGLRLNSERFTKAAAERCGLSERTVQAALALVEALTPEVILVLRGTEWARNASELQRLAAEPAERQLRLAQLHAKGDASTVAKARITAGEAPAGEADPQEAIFRHLVANWDRARKDTRRRFLAHAGLSEKAVRERMPKVSEIIADPRQVDIEEAITATRRGRRS